MYIGRLLCVNGTFAVCQWDICCVIIASLLCDTVQTLDAIHGIAIEVVSWGLLRLHFLHLVQNWLTCQ